jgi:tetratricopeptide (TPR) repeat protein
MTALAEAERLMKLAEDGTEDVAEKEKLFAQALDLFRSGGGSPLDVIRCFRHLGAIASARGEARAAVAHYEACLSYMEGDGEGGGGAMDDALMRGAIGDSLGDALMAAGDWPRAAMQLQDNLATWLEMSPMEAVASMIKIAECRRMMGEFDGALHALQTAMNTRNAHDEEDDEEVFAAILEGIAAAYEGKGDHLRALNVANDVLELKREAEEGTFSKESIMSTIQTIARLRSQKK